MNGRTRYIASALEPESWPRLLSPRGNPLAEIAFAGRSNVGKSTLINILSGQKGLAKISSTPGKTQRLQFFCFDERYLLVDLPATDMQKRLKNSVQSGRQQSIGT
jgi:GTP-binding protein